MHVEVPLVAELFLPCPKAFIRLCRCTLVNNIASSTLSIPHMHARPSWCSGITCKRRSKKGSMYGNVNCNWTHKYNSKQNKSDWMHIGQTSNCKQDPAPNTADVG